MMACGLICMSGDGVGVVGGIVVVVTTKVTTPCWRITLKTTHSATGHSIHRQGSFVNEVEHIYLKTCYCSAIS